MPDTVFVPVFDNKKVLQLESEIKFFKSVVDSMNNTINENDYMNGRKVEKVKYYISICERNPRNKKFFYGWVKRTMSDK